MEPINLVHLLNHQIIQYLPFGVIVLDREMKIIGWNSWMEHFSGTNRSDVQDQPIQRFFPALEKRRLLAEIETVFETGKTLTYSWTIEPHFLVFAGPHADPRADQLIQETVVKPLVDEDGHIQAVGIFVHDMTNHSNQVTQLEFLNQGLACLNRDLEKVNRLKSDILANISHELRTPLTNILGYLDLLENGLVESAEESAEFFSNIRCNATDLLCLINDLIDSAEIESGQVDLDLQNLSLLEILTEVHALMNNKATTKGLKFDLEMASPDLLVRCDYQKFKQCLFNVVGNAIKFTETGGVTIRARDNRSGLAVIEVTDTGIGIELEQMDHIFKEFHQGDNSATRRFGGTGLGMALTRSWLEYMGGSVTISSPGPGQGTTVEIGIPLALSE